MEAIERAGRVTSSTGEVDRDGEIVGELVERIGTARDVGRYCERPGLDERLIGAGVDPAPLRRMLGVSS